MSNLDYFEGSEYMDMPEVFGGGGEETLAALLEALSTNDFPSLLNELNVLSMNLAVAQEDMLAMFPIEQLVHTLINCAQKDEVPDIVVQALTCLTNLLDIAPELAGLVTGMGGLRVLAAKMMNLEYIDVAEAAIKALEKVAAENSEEVLKQGVFGNLLNIIEFFEVHLQKQILGIAVNLASMVPSKEVYRTLVYPYIQVLTGLLEKPQHTERVLEILANLITSMESFSQGNDFESLNAYGLVRVITNLIETRSDLTELCCRVLSTLCRSSAQLVSEFFAVNGPNLLRHELTKQDLTAATVEALCVIEALLPFTKSDSPLEKEKTRIYQTNAEYLDLLAEIVFPNVVFIYENFASKTLRVMILESLEKLSAVAPARLLTKYATGAPFATFLAYLVGSEDLKTVFTALKIITNFYEKIPREVSYTFSREGVIARIEELKEPENLKKLKGHSKLPRTLQRIFSGYEDSHRPVDFPELKRSVSDNKDERKQQILTLARGVLTKHRRYENRRALQVFKELKSLIGQISNGAETWTKLLELIDSENLSYYEVHRAGLVPALWAWLTEPTLSLPRLSEFLGVFNKASQKGETYLAKLVSLLIGCSRFVQNFTVKINEHSHMRPYSRIRVSFEYVSGELACPLQDLFEQVKHFHLDLHPTFSIDSIHSQLLKVKSREDISHLRQSLNDQVNDRKRKLYEQLLEMGLSPEEAMNEVELQQDNFQEAELVVPTRKRSEDFPYKLEFFVNEKQISRGMKLLDLTREESLNVTFQLSAVESDCVRFSIDPQTIYRDLMNRSQLVGLSPQDKAFPYLRLVKLLSLLNSLTPNILGPTSVLGTTSQIPNVSRLPLTHFKSPKLTALLTRKLADPPLPYTSWTMTLPINCRFLFPFHTRVDYFYTSLYAYNDIDSYRTRYKVRVLRDAVLDTAMNVFSDTNLLRHGYLDIEYEGEVGTGLGPTLEFYSLLAKEVRGLQIWRNQQELGLFPEPRVEETELFTMLGKLIAKVLLDRKQIDLPFSSIWWKLVLKEPLTLIDLCEIDPSLGKTLLEFGELINKAKKQEPALYKGMDVADLGLTFVLPGFNHELKAEGEKCAVTITNLEEYVLSVTHATIALDPQIAAFRRGLEALIPLDVIRCFYPEEIESLVCGDSDETWEIESLKKCVVPDHGYTSSSMTFYHVIKCMAQFNKVERRQFLQFITGAPRLPLGGFAQLHPKLTIVKKEPSEPGTSPNDFLPSVMTCQNYLKMPDYSSFSVLKERLVYAMNEGYEAFHLS